MDVVADALLKLSTKDSIYGSLSNFEIVKKIGKGQFSDVYKAKCKCDNQLVALKTISIYEMEDLKARSDCMNEINVLQRLNHPNVIRYLASLIENNILHIVLELADAGDLSDMIMFFANKNCLIPEKTIWKFFVQISCGIKHLHSMRVVHRDIKPANVFITSNSVVKIGDFGFGRFLTSKDLFAHSLVGTPYYMAPERVGERGYDFKVDIWSLGCVLYELATLQSPFYGERVSLTSLFQKIESANYPPIPSNVYSEELHQMVTNCLITDSTKRPDICFVHSFSQEMHMKWSSTELKDAT